MISSIITQTTSTHIPLFVCSISGTSYSSVLGICDAIATEDDNFNLKNIQVYFKSMISFKEAWLNIKLRNTLNYYLTSNFSNLLMFS